MAGELKASNVFLKSCHKELENEVGVQRERYPIQVSVRNAITDQNEDLQAK